MSKMRNLLIGGFAAAGIVFGGRALLQNKIESDTLCSQNNGTIAAITIDKDGSEMVTTQYADGSVAGEFRVDGETTRFSLLPKRKASPATTFIAKTAIDLCDSKLASKLAGPGN